jgi:hypothetical protein
MDGFVTREVRLQPGAFPAELRLELEPAGPLAHLSVRAGYPLDVLWHGRVLARGQQAPRVDLPAGRHSITLVAPSVFLRREVAVTLVGGADTSLDAPPVGKVNIRAVPENCEVFIDGTFVDYPPILDKSIVAGSHTLTFKWPDGVKKQDPLDVTSGGVAFAIGRKE